MEHGLNRRMLQKRLYVSTVIQFDDGNGREERGKRKEESTRMLARDEDR